MSVAADILHFLRDPRSFAQASRGLVDHVGSLSEVERAISRVGEYPLRAAQVEAWRGLGALRAGLLLGPPGTGKTHLLSWLVLGHVWQRQGNALPSRVFLTAMTRSAIETLLIAVAKRAACGPQAVELVCIGSVSDEPLPPNVFVANLKDQDSCRELKQRLRAPGVVVGGTVWQLANLIEGRLIESNDRHTSPFFDLIAIDEASQLMLTQSLMALAGLAPEGRVIVSGDDKQLPPLQSMDDLVIDGRAIGGSLYAFMKQQGVPEFALRETFRLNEPLTVFPKATFYGDAYESAQPVAARRLALRTNWREGLEPWEELVLDPDHPITVIVHDGPTASTESPSEAAIAARVAILLRDRLCDEQGHPYSADEFWSERVALISPHRAQNRALRNRLRDAGEQPFVDTVDRIQGKERDAIVMSYTVSDAEFALAEAEFLFSPGRLNVATTRARSKLVLIISRTLLSVMPFEQVTLNNAEVLRNYVFSCGPIWMGDIDLAAGVPLPIEVRARGFEASALQPLVGKPVVSAEEPIGQDILDSRLDALRAIVRDVAAEDRLGNAWIDKLAKRLGQRDRNAALLADLVKLHHSGWIELKIGRNGAWFAKPVGARRSVVALDDPGILDRVGQAIGRGRKRYHSFRNNFAWMDERGADALRLLIEHECKDISFFIADDGDEWIDRHGPRASAPKAPVTPELRDEDFVLLNVLEDFEKRKIDVGLFELWTSHEDLARLASIDLEEVASRLAALSRHGYVLLAAEGRIRSRMAELARLLRHLKQRFAKEDATDRPYLVRSVKVEFQDRRKPRRDHALAEVFDRAAEVAPSDTAKEALAELNALLQRLWGKQAAVAGFQARALETVFSAWTAPPKPATVVVAADTGAGKTEAGLFPLIIGAALDLKEDRGGVRAILAYPRVRLASNQAQRIAKYLSAADPASTIARLTLGLQFGEVPTAWSFLDRSGRAVANTGWHRAGGGFAFPLFGCPNDEAPLIVTPGGGRDGADALSCTSCGWRFERWIGTKEGIRSRPPSLFVPTVDSLHQWLNDHRCAALFGDGAIGPRALLADEIHLYAGTQGAQVAQTFRRLLHRMSVNGGGAEPVAIGMSATLGEPGLAFSCMIGRTGAVEIAPQPDEMPPNPRGREYFYFIQPEIESRDRDVAGASTAIQSIMALAHGMRRRTGADGGFRSLVFLDSIDKVRRLHADYIDAEERSALARLRTTQFPDDPITGEARSGCCGDPANCTVFNDGECWFFDATDARQTYANGEAWEPGRQLQVAKRPVTSQTGEDAERMIKASDVIFATSSLEVGYDDPDITFVFQHYAPQNLASFIQRKGRAGRGLDDRPTTAVTLSLYAPRDTHWFDRPHAMLDASGFRAPLNPDNHFVRRGQMLCLVLDAVASLEGRNGHIGISPDSRLSSESTELATKWVEACFGSNCWREQGADDLVSFWQMALQQGSLPSANSKQTWREALQWIPRFLSTPISMPLVQVRVGGTDPIEEDIALAFALGAPGNVSRRFSPNEGHWRPPVKGMAPWLTVDDYRQAKRLEIGATDLADLLHDMPVDARTCYSSGAETTVLHPTAITLEVAGTFGLDRKGDGWDPRRFVDAGGELHESPAPARNGVGAKSRGNLRTFVIIKAEETLAHRLPGGDLCAALKTDAFWSVSDVVPPSTGLRVAKVAWGADVEIVCVPPPAQNGPRPEPLHWQQIFIDPRSNLPLLHGYVLDTEGLRIKVDSEKLDHFVDRELALGPTIELQLSQIQTLLTMRLQTGQLDRFSSGLLGRLVAIAVTSGDYAAELAKLMDRRWRQDAFSDLLRTVRRERLSADPMLSERRIERAVQALVEAGADEALRVAFADTHNPAFLTQHVRSMVLHSLALRLRQLFALVSQGDERTLITHVKLPIAYDGDSDDTITIAEVGQFGDGTTRAFVERWDEARSLWNSGFATRCPNAEEDQVVEWIFSRPERHEAWKALNPRRVEDIESLRRELSEDMNVPKLPHSVTRLVFGTLEVASEMSHMLDAGAAVWRMRAHLEQVLGRRADGWEVASRVMSLADNRATEAPLGALFTAYGSIPEINGGEGTRSPRERFAEQVYRLGHRLCADGCRACVQQDSELLSGDLMRATVSRTMLGRFLSMDGNR